MKPSKLFADTDLCVKCGLCVPHCPTYRKTLDENESPRGRISLIQAWSNGDLADSPSLRGHLDNCLLCRTCESLCPAKVPYSKLVDDFRNKVGKGPLSITSRVLSAFSRSVLPNKKFSGFAASLVQRLESSGFPLARFFPADGPRNFLEEIRPRRTRKSSHRTRFARRGRVGLFIGCTGDLFDGPAIDASISVLGLLGYDVLMFPDQNCCGALHLHAGDAKHAAKLAAENLQAFGKIDLDAIITLATGCGAMLIEYPDYFPNSEKFSSKVIDICRFVQQSDQFSKIGLEALDAKILVHTPCSLANVLKGAEAPLKLADAIPHARVATVNQAIRCCGAAGGYMLEHPKMAKAIRQDLLDILAEEKPDYLLTGNIGCALHLKAGIREQGIPTDVIHPIVLFERQIKKPEIF